MKSLILVTHDKGKIIEVNAIAKKYGVEVKMPGKVEKLEIQSDSLKDVAEFSAKRAYDELKEALVVDDSGIFIKSLNGFPGVYSASVTKAIGNKGILKLMDGITDRSAYVECAACFCDGSRIKLFSGRIDGDITYNEKGSMGFGFDPIFSPKSYGGKTMAELDTDDKNVISHRGKAFQQFFEWYSNE